MDEKNKKLEKIFQTIMQNVERMKEINKRIDDSNAKLKKAIKTLKEVNKKLKEIDKISNKDRVLN